MRSLRRRDARAVVAACAVFAVGAGRADAAARRFTVDEAHSRLHVLVGKAGLFSFAAGHTHDVESNGLTGAASIDADDLSRSSLRLVIRTATLRVSPKGEPPDDVPKVQHTMESEQVLDVAKYPELVFESTRVEVKSRSGAAIELAVTGNLTLHGTTRPVTVPVRAELGGSSLTANGRFEVKQTDYVIAPVSVAGVVSVKDELAIDFTIVARE